MKKCLLIFIIFVVSCSSQNQSPFYFYDDSLGEIPELFFEYGSKDSSLSLPDSKEVFHYENGIFCVYSLPISLYKLELGAKFRICSKLDEESSNRWKTGFSLLKNLKSEYPTFLESGKGWNLSFKTFAKWKEKRREMVPVLEWKEQVFSTGLVTYQSFAIPHPIFLQKSNTECEVVYRSYSLSVSENQTPTIVFEFPCPNVEKILDLVLSQNQSWISSCEIDSPNISEIFRHSESDYVRYLEWENTKDKVICPYAETLEREKEGVTITFQSEDFRKRSRVMLPHGILLLSDHPKFQGINISKQFLSQLGTQETIRFGESILYDNSFDFKQGGEYFAKQWRTTSCRDQKNLWESEESFCGNPGIPNYLEQNAETNPIPQCNPSQIRLTEFYPGNESVPNFPLPAYFEFRNEGTSCDLSSLNWILNGDVYPFSAKEEILKQNGIFLFTRELWLGWNLLERKKPFYIPKQVFQIPPFSIQNRKTEESFSFQFDPNRYHLLRKGNQNRFSIVVQEKEFPHPRITSDSKLLSFGFQLSPGVHESNQIQLIGSSLLEFAQNPNPFLDFGFFEGEEGIGSFQSSEKKDYFYWKQSGRKMETFGYEPNQCNGENIYHLPSGFFGESFKSLLYTDKDTSNNHLTVWNDSLLKEKSYDGSRSLHPEITPILFSSSMVSSIPCPGLWRSPGSEKTASLEIVKLKDQAGYLANSALGNLGSIFFGNQRQKLAISVIPLFSLQFNLDVTNVLFGHPEEQMYSYFTHPNLIKPVGFLEKKGPIQIEAIYPNPFLSQNEWVYVCNRSGNTEDLSLYLIEDETSTDDLVSYQSRFPNEIPIGKNGKGFITNDTVLPPSSCAWIVDPDGKDWYLPIFHSESDRLITVVTTQTIGNGISSGEFLQLRKKSNGVSILISSFGHKESPSNFHKTVSTGEYIWLKTNAEGTTPDDFEVYREEN
ncbi:hypothetical protein LPTSP2_05540 [Leptospira ellinghausenii]|uniref:Lipoprotein n=1 Tax=Leptospira ellinghausenii TaxID=1917822 RepID=A0A2P2D9I7_9LEPT|nr:hypothetical protein [Leptospira ellinghausenii]GBF41282.1 hypothetical protein LPTSP2_05540 [Leptospira ellinghausenii]